MDKIKIQDENQLMANVSVINLLSKYDVQLKRMIRGKRHTTILAENCKDKVKYRIELNTRKIDEILDQLTKKFEGKNYKR